MEENTKSEEVFFATEVTKMVSLICETLPNSLQNLVIEILLVAFNIKSFNQAQGVKERSIKVLQDGRRLSTRWNVINKFFWLNIFISLLRSRFVK